MALALWRSAGEGAITELPGQPSGFASMVGTALRLRSSGQYKSRHDPAQDHRCCLVLLSEQEAIRDESIASRRGDYGATLVGWLRPWIGRRESQQRSRREWTRVRDSASPPGKEIFKRRVQYRAVVHQATALLLRHRSSRSRACDRLLPANR